MHSVMLCRLNIHKEVRYIQILIAPGAILINRLTKNLNRVI